MDETIGAVSFVVTDPPQETETEEGTTLVKYCSFNWKIWAHGTSFYLKINNQAMSETKISLHGPDQREGMTPVLRFGPDSTFIAKDETEYGSLIVAPNTDWPIKFTGTSITSRVRRVIRFSFTSEMFTEGAPNGLPVSLSKTATKRGVHGRFTAPPEGGLFVDLYIASPGTDPYWQYEDQTRAADAGVGPIVNDAGQTLTLVAHKVSNPHRRDPNWQKATHDDIAQMSSEALQRCVVFNADERGLLWITEKIAPADFGAENDDLLVGVQRPHRQTTPPTPAASDD